MRICHSRAPLVLSILAVFVLKLGVLWQLHDHPLLQPGGGLDTDYYLQLAQRVAGGDLLLAPGLYFVSPLYIYFLAAGLAAGGGSLVFVQLIQIALGTAACALVWLTAREWFGARAAWIASALAALTGVFTFYEVLILQAALDPFLTALDLQLLTLALRRPGARWPLAAGMAVAIHALNRPNIVIVGAGVVVLLFARRGSRRVAAPVFLAGLLAGFTPVAVRNSIAAGTFVPVPSHGGLNLYIGNNPRADGTYRHVEGITPNIAGQAADARRVSERAEGRALSDTEVSTYFTRRALAWMRDDPGAAARLFVRKVAFTLNATFLTLNYSYPFYRERSAVLRALVVGPLVLVPLGLAGLFAHRLRGSRAPAGFGVWAATVPLLVLSVAIFFVASRYRLPLLVPLCVTAGGLADAFGRLVPARRLAPAALALAAVLLLTALAAWDFGLDDGRTEEETRMAVWLASAGRTAEAVRMADAVSGPLSGVADFRVGQALERAGRLPEAIARYERALQRNPGQADVKRAAARAHDRLGAMLAAKGRISDALPHLQDAVRLDPRRPSAHLNLAVAYAQAGQLTEARREGERALALDPSYARARAFLNQLERVRPQQ